MLDAERPLSLFGYDLGRAVHYVRAGWAEFLWGEDSPLLPALDEAVLAHREDGGQCYLRSGRPVADPGAQAASSEAVILPARLALVRTLQLPPAAEAELESVVALEVKASSPFPPEDTCYGWALLGRDAAGIEVHLVISSRSAVMAWIGERLDCHDVQAYEVWAAAGERMVMLRGFGEDARRRRNRRRLGRMAALFGACLLLLVAITAVAAGGSYLALQQVEEQQARAMQSAREAVALRESLAASRAMLDVARDLLARYPSPHSELQRLAALLDDDTWLSSVELRDGTIRIEGQSANAAQVMGQLLEHPAYARVEAPVAFSKVRDGTERLVLDLTLAEMADQ